MAETAACFTAALALSVPVAQAQEAAPGAEPTASAPQPYVAPPWTYKTRQLSRNDVDRMPIELLMTRDLTNERGLKWRMRRWKEKQAEMQQEAIQEHRERSKLLKELDALKV